MAELASICFALVFLARGDSGRQSSSRLRQSLLSTIAMVDSTREIKGVIEKDTRIYITSLDMIATLLAPVIRSHWAIENSLHWVMDMVFRDDECRVRTNHAPANFTTIKHMAHNLLRRPAGKDSFRLRRKVAGWDDEFLGSLIHRMILSPDSPGYCHTSAARPD